MHKIPLLIITRSLDVGGTERHLLEILPRLNASNFDVHVYPLYTEGSLTSSFAEAGLIKNNTNKNNNRLSNLISLALKIRKLNPIVHCFLPEPYLIGGSIALTQKAKAVLMSRRSRNHYQHQHPIATWYERHLHHHMDALVGNSQRVVQDLLDEGAPAERVRLIYNGINVNRFPSSRDRIEIRRSVRAKLNISEHTLLFICVANLFSYKGHADLLEAIASLGTSFLSTSILLLVGRDAGEYQSLKTQAFSLGISNQICFLGERQDIPDLLAASDIGVLTSHEEGFSNAVLEMMAAGLAVIATNVGGNSEAIFDNKCGNIVQAHQPLDIAAAMHSLLRDPNRRRAMGEAARQRIIDKFSLDACSAAYSNMYEEIWVRYNPRLSSKKTNDY